MRNYLCLVFCLCFPASLHTAQAQTCNTNMAASTPDSQFLDNNNGTVTDRKTGLMWKKCVEGVSGSNCDSGSPGGFFTWQAALQQPGVINSSGFAGYHDWRLPNIKELRSIVEERCYEPAINLNLFPNTPSSVVWSGSPHAYDLYYAWVVNFINGNSDNDYRNDVSHVRLVRGGQ